MLAVFRRNDFTAFFAFILLAFCLRLSFIIRPESVNNLGDFNYSLYGANRFLFDFYKDHHIIYILFSTVYYCLLAIYIKNVVINERLFSGRNYIPALSFILLTATLPQFVVFSMASLSLPFVFTAFYLMIIKGNRRGGHRSLFFFAGLLVGIAVIIHWTNILFLLCMILVSLNTGSPGLREFMSYLMGFFLVFYLVFGFQYVFTGQLPGRYLGKIELHLPVYTRYIPSIIVLSILNIFIFIYGLYISRNRVIENRVITIRKWNGVVTYFIFAVIVGFLAVFFPSAYWVHVLVPFSIILSSAFINNKRKFNNFTFYIVFLVIIGVQWIIRFM